jgi:hypothetical protein
MLPALAAGTSMSFADQGEAASIGRDERELAVLEIEIHAVEDVARLVVDCAYATLFSIEVSSPCSSV